MAKGRAEQITRKIPGALNTLLFPMVSKEENSEKSIPLIAKAFRVTFLIQFVIVILLMLVIKPM
jgi:O-antigen/teichoic acid export membrane protein